MNKNQKFRKTRLAKEAEMDNRFPATTAARKLGVHPKAIQTYLLPCERHQTGFGTTEYYDIDIYLKLFFKQDISDSGYSKERIRDVKDTWEKMQKYKPEKTTEKRYTAEVSFLIFSGTKNNLKVTPYHYYDLEVIEKGQFYTFKTPSGDIRKKIGSRGTVVRQNFSFEQESFLSQIR